MRALAILLAACVAACSPSSSPSPKPTPAPAPPQEKILAVGRGASYACAVRETGAVDCWGAIGQGAMPDPSVRRIPGVADAVAIMPDASCVRRRNGEASCLAEDRLEFVPRPSDPIALSTTTGDRLTCQVGAGGEVTCGPTDRSAPAVPLQGMPPVRRLAIARSYWDDRGCAILATGAFRCFAIKEDQGKLVATATDRDDHQLDAFDAAAFANATDFVVWHDDEGASRQLFRVAAIVGGKVVQWTPGEPVRVLPELADAVQLAPGCALRASGAVACWGSNDGGALGQPTTIGRLRRPPTPVVGLTNVAQLALADADSWALTRGGGVYHWGASGEGSATLVALPHDAAAPQAIAATTAGSACVLDGRGAVWCWTRAARAFSRMIPGGIHAIAGEQTTLLAVAADGAAQRVRIDPPPRGEDEVPKQPERAPAHITALAGSDWHACALAADGAVVCDQGWRATGFHAQQVVLSSLYGCTLEDGRSRCFQFDTNTDAVKPESLGPVITGASDLALSHSAVCAVQAGAVRCWSIYRDGGVPAEVLARGAVDIELGRADPDDASSWTSVPGPMFGCAILTDRTVTCWGSNRAGELGDGSIAASARPLVVPGLQ